MKISNRHPKGKWLHVKINGYTERVWLGAYSTVDLPYVTDRNQLNLNAHEEAIIHVEGKFGVEVDNVEDLFQYTVSMTEGVASGGTTSLSATTLSINEGLSTSFYIYPETSYYVSAYTVNNVSAIAEISDTSASTITATVTVNNDKDLFVGFAAFGD